MMTKDNFCLNYNQSIKVSYVYSPHLQIKKNYFPQRNLHSLLMQRSLTL